MNIDEKVFSLRLHKDLYARLKAVSEHDKRSMNNWAIVALEKEIERYEKGIDVKIMPHKS